MGFINKVFEYNPKKENDPFIHKQFINGDLQRQFCDLCVSYGVLISSKKCTNETHWIFAPITVYDFFFAGLKINCLGVECSRKMHVIHLYACRWQVNLAPFVPYRSIELLKYFKECRDDLDLLNAEESRAGRARYNYFFWEHQEVKKRFIFHRRFKIFHR